MPGRAEGIASRQKTCPAWLPWDLMTFQSPDLASLLENENMSHRGVESVDPKKGNRQVGQQTLYSLSSEDSGPGDGISGCPEERP